MRRLRVVLLAGLIALGGCESQGDRCEREYQELKAEWGLKIARSSGEQQKDIIRQMEQILQQKRDKCN